VGAVSRDRFGDRIAAALAADGVALDERLRTERPTSLAMAELDATGAATYRIRFAGTSAERFSADLALAAAPRDPAALHAGSLGLVLEPLAGGVEALGARHAGAALVMVDPNVRPALVADVEAYRRRLWRILAQADVVKVSEEDLGVLAPGLPAEAAARGLLGRGPRLVLLTLGARGAVALGAFGAIHDAGMAVDVADTIGAGDVFSGAWLARWLELDAPLGDAAAVREATAFACRAAALSCARPGASPPSRAELDAFSSPAATPRP
jgi:fructokinase